MLNHNRRQKSSFKIAPALWAASLLAGCGGESTTPPDPGFANHSCNEIETECVQIAGGDTQALLDATNALEPGTTLILGAGTFALENGITIRNADGTHLIGQGIDQTTLDFGPATAQVNGVDVIGDDFLIQDLTVLDSPKDGVRVEASKGVVFRRIRTTWTNAADKTNGAYGIYPVKSSDVLVEDSRAENASDAGLYVGQSRNVIVRNNVITGNVAGLEIENTQYADVYGNLAENNTAGIVVFDLPGNPIIGHDVRLRDNTIRNNNLANFSPGGTVSMIPAGTGTFAMASRRVEITGNVYENNQTGDIALISGLVVDSDPSVWELTEAEIVGDWQGLGLMPGAAPSSIMNFRTENVVVAGNSHTNSGTHPDTSRDLGLLLAILYGSHPIDAVIYDAIGESSIDATDIAKNSNDNHICIGGNSDGSFAILDLGTQMGAPGSPFLKNATAPLAHFSCTELTGGPVAAVSLASAN